MIPKTYITKLPLPGLKAGAKSVFRDDKFIFITDKSRTTDSGIVKMQWEFTEYEILNSPEFFEEVKEKSKLEQFMSGELAIEYRKEDHRKIESFLIEHLPNDYYLKVSNMSYNNRFYWLMEHNKSLWIAGNATTLPTCLISELTETPEQPAKSIKSPIGLLPRKLHCEFRLNDIDAAIERYKSVNKSIPKEWVFERNELNAELLMLGLDNKNVPGSENIPKPEVVEDKKTYILQKSCEVFHLPKGTEIYYSEYNHCYKANDKMLFDSNYVENNTHLFKLKEATEIEFYDFCKQHNLDIYWEQKPKVKSGVDGVDYYDEFQVRFRETVTNLLGTPIPNGVGSNIENAISDYCKLLSGKRILIDWKPINIPKLIYKNIYSEKSPEIEPATDQSKTRIPFIDYWNNEDTLGISLWMLTQDVLSMKSGTILTALQWRNWLLKIIPILNQDVFSVDGLFRPVHPDSEFYKSEIPNNKPNWKDLPEWAEWLYYSPDCWLATEIKPIITNSGFVQEKYLIKFKCFNSTNLSSIHPEFWRTSLEQRPKDNTTNKKEDTNPEVIDDVLELIILGGFMAFPSSFKLTQEKLNKARILIKEAVKRYRLNSKTFPLDRNAPKV